MNIEYLGEHRLPGNLGHLAVVLAFTSAILSCISYFVSSKEKEGTFGWHMLGRWSFRFHCVMVICIFAFLASIIANHYFEYFYAWSHSSRIMPLKYLLSCI